MRRRLQRGLIQDDDDVCPRSSFSSQSTASEKIIRSAVILTFCEPSAEYILLWNMFSTHMSDDTCQGMVIQDGESMAESMALQHIKQQIGLHRWTLNRIWLTRAFGGARHSTA